MKGPTESSTVGVFLAVEDGFTKRQDGYIFLSRTFLFTSKEGSVGLGLCLQHSY